VNSKPRQLDVVYLGLWPIAHKSEGLNVLLCDMLKPLVTDGVKVVVHTTDRHAKNVTLALEGNGVDLSAVAIKSHPVGSIALRILQRLSRRNIKKIREKSRFNEVVRKFSMAIARKAEQLFLWGIDFTLFNFLYKLPISIVLAGILLLSGLVVGVVIFIIAILLGVPLLAFYKLMNLSRGFAYARLNFIRSYRNKIKAAYVQVRTNLIPHLFEREQVRFAKVINKDKSIDRLFFFTAFDGHVVRLVTKKKVVVFPDAVTYLFPLRFSGMLVASQMSSLRMSVANADGIVCYSKFVRDAQLRKIFPVEVMLKPIEVIPQGYFTPDMNLNIDRKVAQKSMNSHRNLIQNFFPELLLNPPQVNFGEFDYLIYPTVDRPHKNVTTLIKAFSILLRKNHLNLKLILTSPHVTHDVQQLILKERLHYDVLYIPSVPIAVLDLLFKGASLMVHPSLTEGGDIFNFSRAVSVDCPALLADVPVVREMFDRGNINPEIYEKWLFDPVDPVLLAKKINETFSARDDLVKEQGIYLENLSRYDFRQMAYRYLEFIEKV
jgi:hypothetical protein